MLEKGKRPPRTGLLRKLYAWMMRNAKGRHAWAALACFAFAEASFFPVPPDIMLMPMMLADRKRAFALSAWCTLWSVIGGMLGYAIGALFWDTAGIWLIHLFHVPMSEVQSLRLKYTEHAYLITVQGLTPIPYKLVTITSGLASVPFAAFMLYSTIGRGLRFIVLEGILVYFFGEQARIFLERYMELIMIVVLGLIILGVVLVRYLA